MYILVLRDDKEALYYDRFDYDDMLNFIRDEALWNNFYVIMKDENEWKDITEVAYDEAQTYEEDCAKEAAGLRLEAPIVI